VGSAQESSELLCFTEQGSGPPLLLVHGLMVSGEMFEPVVKHFAARHRVIVPDLRGHGRSRGLPPAVYGSDPSRCDRLVLSCTYAFNMATTREKVEGHLVPLLVRLLGMKGMARFVVSQGTKDLGKERADWLAGLMADQDRKLMLAAWRQTMAFDSRHRLTEIDCPTLIVAGSNDQAVPIHHAKMLHDGITGAQLVLVEGADHALIWAHTEEFVQVTETFIDA
jgi:pimeloyl-ACP methyl ester carboxylesterase